jgi:predicted RNase H-like HicB family nuclease
MQVFVMKDNVFSFPIVIMKEGKWFVASCPALDVATQGKTEKEVRENMEDLIRDYLEDKDTPKPSKNVELSSISFVQATISKGGKHVKVKAAAH